MTDSRGEHSNGLALELNRKSARLQYISIAGPLGGGLLLILSGVLGAITGALTDTLSLGLVGTGVFLLILPLNKGLGGLFEVETDENREKIRSKTEPGDEGDDRSDRTVNVRGDNLTVWNVSDKSSRESSEALQRQEAILREIYLQGLAQAKLSFRVSTVFAAVGAAFLLLGVVLAVVNASTNGAQYASIVAGSAGVVVNITSNLFFAQSNRTRRNMAEQGRLLREESQEDRRLSAARQITYTVSDARLRDSTLARIALELAGGLGSASATGASAGDGEVPAGAADESNPASSSADSQVGDG